MWSSLWSQINGALAEQLYPRGEVVKPLSIKVWVALSWPADLPPCRPGPTPMHPGTLPIKRERVSGE